MVIGLGHAALFYYFLVKSGEYFFEMPRLPLMAVYSLLVVGCWSSGSGARPASDVRPSSLVVVESPWMHGVVEHIVRQVK